MDIAICPSELQRQSMAINQPSYTHSLADEIAAALQEALPHASTIVRFIDPETGSRLWAARGPDRPDADPDLLDEILSQQEDTVVSHDGAGGLPNASDVNFTAVPIESTTPNAHRGYLAAYSDERGFPTPRDQAVLKMAAAAAQNALRRLGPEHDGAASITPNLERLLDHQQQRPAAPEEYSQRPEYMAALGTLAAGLSHDLGNLLLPIRLRLATIETRMDDSRFAQDFGAIRSCLDSMQRLTHGLELFSLNPNELAASEGSVALHEWWNDVEPFLRNALPQNVKLKVDIPRGLPSVRIARHLLAQVMLNLVQNAGEALQSRDRGCVTIRARCTDDDQTVLISVKDDGVGMTEEVCARCFEPFYTTKTRAISTGLGLSLVHGIIKRAEGSVHVQSRPGNGTTIELTLPITAAAEAAGDQAGRAPTAAVAISDQRLCGFVKTFLESLGFAVASQSGPPPRGSVLWATDDAQEVDRSAAAYLNGSNRCVIVLGHFEGKEPDSRIVVLESTPDRAGLARSLRHCAQQVLKPLKPVDATNETKRTCHTNTNLCAED